MAERAGGETENCQAPLSTHIILSSAQIFRNVIYKVAAEKIMCKKLVSKQRGDNDDDLHNPQATKYGAE